MRSLLRRDDKFADNWGAEKNVNNTACQKQVFSYFKLK
jgi:hypothetical protein